MGKIPLPLKSLGSLLFFIISIGISFYCYFFDQYLELIADSFLYKFDFHKYLWAYIFLYLIFIMLLCNIGKKINRIVSKLYNTFVELGPNLFIYVFGVLLLGILMPAQICHWQHLQSFFLFNGDYIFILQMTLIIIPTIVYIDNFQKDEKQVGNTADRNIKNQESDSGKSQQNTEDESTEKVKDDSILINNPKSSLKDDRYNFGPKVKAVVTDIKKYFDFVKTIKDDESKIYRQLILGNWGSGKTTLLHFVKEVLENLKNDFDFIIIKLDVSNYVDLSKLYIHFFNLLTKEIDKSLYLPNIFIKKIIERAIEVLIKGIKVYELRNKLEDIPEIEDSFEQLNKIVTKKLNKKVICFIDDIDRIKTEDIDHVFNLLRILSCTFNKMVVIVAADEIALKKYARFIVNIPNHPPNQNGKIEKQDFDKGTHDVIRKYFDYTYYMPTFSSSYLEEKIHDFIENTINNVPIAEQFKDLMKNEYKQEKSTIYNFAYNNIKTIRDWIQFTKSIKVEIETYNFLIFLPDLIVLNLAKLFDMEGFDLLRSEYNKISFDRKFEKRINVEKHTISEDFENLKSKLHSLNRTSLINHLFKQMSEFVDESSSNNKENSDYELNIYDLYSKYRTKTLKEGKICNLEYGDKYFGPIGATSFETIFGNANKIEDLMRPYKISLLKEFYELIEKESVKKEQLLLETLYHYFEIPPKEENKEEYDNVLRSVFIRVLGNETEKVANIVKLLAKIHTKYHEYAEHSKADFYYNFVFSDIIIPEVFNEKVNTKNVRIFNFLFPDTELSDIISYFIIADFIGKSDSHSELFHPPDKINLLEKQLGAYCEKIRKEARKGLTKVFNNPYYVFRLFVLLYNYTITSDPLISTDEKQKYKDDYEFFLEEYITEMHSDLEFFKQLSIVYEAIWDGRYSDWKFENWIEELDFVISRKELLSLIGKSQSDRDLWKKFPENIRIDLDYFRAKNKIINPPNDT